MAFHPNPAHPNFQVALLPFNVFLPAGSWGISYEISTNETQFDAPNGWNAWRSAFLFLFIVDFKLRYIIM